MYRGEQSRTMTRSGWRAVAATAAAACIVTAVSAVAPAFADDLPSYQNTFAADTTADFTRLMPDDAATLQYDATGQRASVTGSGLGQVFRADSQSPQLLDGTASVRITVTSSYRAGLLFRGVDADNYSFVALDQADVLRIRERIAGVSADILVGNPAHGATVPATLSFATGAHTIKVTYHGDGLEVLVDDVVVYDGNRPRIGTAPVAGRVGIAAWSSTTATFDDLASTPRDTYTATDTFDTGLGTFTKLSSTGTMSNLTASGGTARLFSSTVSGDLIFRDESIETRTNGYASADFDVASISNFRIGLGFRMTDSANYSWAAMETRNRVRVREVVGGTLRDIIIAPTGGDVTADIDLSAGPHTLAVAYFDDALTVILDGRVIYEGLRPHARASTGLGPTMGGVGIVGWSVTDSTIDNLGYAAEAPPLPMDTDAISTASLSATLDKDFPQVLDYTLTPSGASLSGGSTAHRVLINNQSYAPSSVAYTKTATNAAHYVLTIPGVDLDGTGPLAARTVTLTYDLIVTGTVVTTRLVAVTGDDAAARFSVRLDSPVASMPETAPAATIAGSWDGGDFFRAISPTSALPGSLADTAFLSSDDIVATIYTPNSFSSPYYVSVVTTDGTPTGSIASPPFDYRYAGGHRSAREDSSGTVTEVTPESRVFVGGDENADSTIDWQDGAHWVRTQLPQMPESVREFFNGGNWSQVHGAFPASTGDVANRQGFTVPNTTLDQLVEIQRQVDGLTDGVGRQSYEYVGWQGRGHDYGWPSINELPFNPALGNDAEMTDARDAIATFGGDLSFHVNMTDMTDISPAYLRDTTASPYGNRSASTGVLQYPASVFGWNAYKMDMFADFVSGAPSNRQDAFVDRFFAPQFIYQDVMLPYPSGGRTTADENYAMAREIDHWGALGTTAATEYFRNVKYLNGGFLFKNLQTPSTIQGFLSAGNAVISNTRNYNNQATDYIWANLYSDNANTSNVNATWNANLSAPRLASTTFLYSLLNGYLAEQGLQSYEDDTANHRVVTHWGDDTTFAIDTVSGAFTATSGAVTIADGSDRFIPAYDGTDRILMYSASGSTRSWTLPAAYAGASSMDLFRLTTDGRSFVQAVPVAGGTVSVTMAAGTGYVLAPTSATRPATNPDLALGAAMTASSSTSSGPSDYSTTTHLWNGREFATIPASESPSGDWSNEILALTPAMIDAGSLRYEKSAIAGNAADGTASTYWSPNHESARGTVDLADGEAWLSATFPTATAVGRVHVDETSTTGNAVTAYKVQALSGSTWVDVASGSTIPGTDITFTPTTTTRIRLLITGADGMAPRISSFEIYAT